MDPLSPPQTRPKSKQLLFVVLFAVLLVIAAGIIWHERNDKNTTASPVANAATSLTAKQYNDLITHPDTTIKLVIKNNKLVSGPSKITVKKGQSVNVDIATPGNEAVVELDGYGIITETNSSDGASGGFHFVADKTGVFPFYIPGEDNEGAQGTNEPKNNIPLGTIEVK